MSGDDRATVVYGGRRPEGRVGQTLAEALGLARPCGGAGLCGGCTVYAEGALSEPDETERRRLGEARLGMGLRLACRARICGDCRVESPAAELRIESGGRVDRIEEGDCRAVLDIGTTTVAGRIYGRDGRVVSEGGCPNSQASFGADVISRVTAAVSGHREALTAAVRRDINGLLVRLASEAGVSVSEISRLVIVGNSLMLCLVAAGDVTPFTAAPFEGIDLLGRTVAAEEVGTVGLSADCEIYMAPCISAFVGGDGVAAGLACRFDEPSEGGRLMIDLGTNGELMLEAGGRLYAASVAAGPAFEGGGISCGMSASLGAIDRIDIAAGRMQTRVIGGGRPVGICGSGLVDLLCCLERLGELNEGGLLDGERYTVADRVEVRREDIEALVLARAALRAGVERLLERAGLSVASVTETAVAGGFGAALEGGRMEAAGLLPKGLGVGVRSVGNAALDGGALMLSDGGRRRAERLAATALHVEFGGDAAFAEKYIKAMRRVTLA